MSRRRDNLFYVVLKMLNCARASEVRNGFVRQSHDALLRTALTTASYEAKQEVADLCVSILTMADPERVDQYGEAESISMFFTHNPAITKYLAPHTDRLESYLLNPKNLRMWAENVRGEHIYNELAYKDLAAPITLVHLLDALGSTRSSEAREYLRKHATEPHLRAWM